MIQDRNVHRDAKFLRRTASGLWITTESQTDKDVPIYAVQPEWNFRVTGISISANQLQSNPVIIAAGVVSGIDACGSPRVNPGVAVTTFIVDEFYHRRIDVNNLDHLREFQGPIVEGFDEAFTITDGNWGVVLLLVTPPSGGGSTLSNVARSLLMEFPTEQIALDNCPQVPAGFGRVAILTIQAVGGDFIAGTTNTDDGVVAAFNTFDQYGFAARPPEPLSSRRNWWNGGGPSFLNDPSGSRVLQGRGLAGPSQDPSDTSGDIIVVTLREDGGGATQVTDVQTNWTMDYRPFPVGGEGLGDTSVSQTPPSFVP